jgi:hypothetical protein
MGGAIAKRVIGVLTNATLFACFSLKIAKTDNRAALRDALEKVRYSGFLSTFAYSPTDHQGTTGETFVPILIKDGKYWPYKKH